MVTETEDLIFEYFMRREIITNMYNKEGDEERQNCKMQKQHLRDWPDHTLRIKRERICRGSVKIPKSTEAFHCLSLNLSDTEYPKSKLYNERR